MSGTTFKFPSVIGTIPKHLPLFIQIKIDALNISLAFANASSKIR